MTKFRRRLLFYGLVVLFLPLAFWLTALARGFSFDFAAKVLEERGAIFLRADPAGAAIYLDGIEYQPPSGILRTQAFISNLTPGPHTIVVTRDGHHRWGKTLEVRSLEVVDAPAIRLFPRAPKIEPVTSSATSNQTLFAREAARRQLPETASSTLAALELRPSPSSNVSGQMSMVNGQWSSVLLYRDLLLSPDEKKILVRTRNELWVVWLQKERLNGIRNPGEAEQIISSGRNITDALWVPDDSEHVIFAVGDLSTSLGAGKIKIAETDGRGGRNVIDLLEAEDVKFFLEPGTNEILFTNKGDFFRLTL